MSHFWKIRYDIVEHNRGYKPIFYVPSPPIKIATSIHR